MFEAATNELENALASAAPPRTTKVRMDDGEVNSPALVGNPVVAPATPAKTVELTTDAALTSVISLTLRTSAPLIDPPTNSTPRPGAVPSSAAVPVVWRAPLRLPTTRTTRME